jgi:hypothetical protein
MSRNMAHHHMQIFSYLCTKNTLKHLRDSMTVELMFGTYLSLCFREGEYEQKMGFSKKFCLVTHALSPERHRSHERHGLSFRFPLTRS